MDVSKYHTRFPPKEHEEAVRMLLEGLESAGPKQKQQIRADVKENEPILRTGQRMRRSSGELESMKQRRLTQPTSKRPVEKQNFSTYSSSSVDSGSLARCSSGEHEDEEFEFATNNRQILTEQSQRRDSKSLNEDLHFNSESCSASSQEFIRTNNQSTKLMNGRRIPLNPNSSYESSHVQYPLPNMQSKATSTGGSDSISTSGASSDRMEGEKRCSLDEEEDDLNGNYEAIPSRTIATQCDLKSSSSVKQKDANGSSSNPSELASMQASSISSTRYGFYRLSPEVLEQRRELARSVSSRNIAEHLNHSNDLNSFRPPVAQLKRRATVEAPTSISELSSVADANDVQSELELARARRRSLSQEPAQVATESRSVAGSSDRDSISTRSKHDQRFFSQRQRQQQLISRARRDSLPRRPKTALSHVSTSKLRDQADDELYQSDDDDEENNLNSVSNFESNEPRAESNRHRMLLRNRAMSQQVLSSSSKHRSMMANDKENEDDMEPAAESVNGSNSDSELGVEGYRVPQLDEIVVTTRRGRTLGSGGSSPQVMRRNYALRDGPLLRRATLTSTSTGTLSRDSQASSSRPNLRRGNVGTNWANNSAAANHLAKLNYERQLSGCSRQQSNSSRGAPVKSASYSTATNDENQLASQRRALPSSSSAAAAASRVDANFGQRAIQRNGAAGQRFASMSLTRRPQPVAKLIERGSCDVVLNNQSSGLTTNATGKVVAESESSYSEQNHEPAAAAAVRPSESRQRFRAGSQPTTAAAAAAASPNRINHQRAKPTASRVNSSRQAAGQVVARSSSMKQPNRQMMAAAAADDDDDEDAERGLMARGRAEYERRVGECKRCYEEGESARCDYNSAATCRLEHDDDDDDEEPLELVQQRQRFAAEPVSKRLVGQVDGRGSEETSDEASESPLTRTWANPAHASRPNQLNEVGLELNSSLEYAPAAGQQTTRLHSAYQTDQRPLDRRSQRSHSMRDTNSSNLDHTCHLQPRRFETIYRAGQVQQDEQDDLEEGRQQKQQQQLQQLRAKTTQAASVRDEECSLCSSSLEQESGRARLESIACVQAQPLDFDSQQRLNEIGLPEPSDQTTAVVNKRSASHLGLSSIPSGLINRYATTGRATATTTTARDQHHSSQHLDRDHHHHHNQNQQYPAKGPAITGRAMSQQSLTRPTMPLSRRLRRSGGTIGAGSGGSDMGGSSISLVSRLRDGSRYENAHTRNPIVMLIPQVSASAGSNRRQNSSDSLRASSRRASSRLSTRPVIKVGNSSRNSSQDRKHNQRSLSRNGSDSESSSSMMRTLIKPRPVGSGPRGQSDVRSSRRLAAAAATTTRNLKLDSDEENLDEIGQLASELDSYKFRRRYSVPKDAKINWFSKLKQRVTSSKS